MPDQPARCRHSAARPSRLSVQSSQAGEKAPSPASSSDLQSSTLRSLSTGSSPLQDVSNVLQAVCIATSAILQACVLLQCYQQSRSMHTHHRTGSVQHISTAITLTPTSLFCTSGSIIALAAAVGLGLLSRLQQSSRGCVPYWLPQHNLCRYHTALIKLHDCASLTWPPAVCLHSAAEHAAKHVLAQPCK